MGDSVDEGRSCENSEQILERYRTIRNRRSRRDTESSMEDTETFRGDTASSGLERSGWEIQRRYRKTYGR
jgi:hypothetical protein